MPLTWHISHQHRLVTLKIEGALRFSDAIAYLEDISSSGALGFRKLCDARDGFTDMTEGELWSYQGACSGYSEVAPLGPYALVLNDESARSHEPILKKLLVTTERPVRIFGDSEKARAWLMHQPAAPARSSRFLRP
jgi:hypothetical protein